MADKNEPLTESYFYILLCLSQRANHGYGIMQDTAELTKGEVIIGSGTMYGATNNMIKKGWICETISNNPEDKRRRLYQLTASGHKVLQDEIFRLKRLIASSEEVLGGR